MGVKGRRQTPEQIANQRAARQRNDEERLRRRIEAGEVVSNAPYRERLQWLVRHDQPPNMTIVCQRLVAAGFPAFEGRPGTEFTHADTSYLQRTLGMLRCAATYKCGKRYPGRWVNWIPPELADALYVAMEMDPLWDAGERAPIGEMRFRRSEFCGWGGGCVQQPGHGRFGRFCAEHAKVMTNIRKRGFTPSGATKDAKRWKGRKAASVTGDELQAIWDEEFAA